MQDSEAHPQETSRLRAERQVLGHAARLLAAASGFDETLKHTLAACLPGLGDFGFFDAVVAEDEVRRTVAAHQSPRVEALLAPTQWVKQVHPSLNLCALSTGEAALHPDIGEDWYRQVAANDRHLALLQELDFRSMITVPLRYRDELVGALTLFMAASGRRHQQEDLELAAELALLAAPVIVNARLVARHQVTEAALRRSNERLEMAVEAGRVGIWDWHIPSGLVTWSDRVYEVYGLPPGGDTGGYAGFRQRVHPEDWPQVERGLQQALAGGPAYDLEFRTLRPDGAVRWVSTRSNLVRDEQGEPLRMVGASIDITERMALLAAERKARAEAEDARRRLEVLASAGALLARSLDPGDTLQSVASSIVPGIADWVRIDLLDEHGVSRRALAYHTDPERAQRALAMAKTMRASPKTIGSMGWCMENGQPHYGRFDQPPASEDPVLRAYTETFGMHEHYIVPLVARGRTIGVMGVLQAESGRILDEADRALIRELGQRAALAIDNARAYAEADAARRQAEAANRAKDEFLAMLGHELRNPLAPITTALELMSKRDTDAHQEERRIIGRQVTHLSRLIDDLLDVSRITQGKVELKRADVDMRTVVGHALEQTRPLFERRAHPVRVSLPDAPAMVHGDPTRLTQVLCNLLVNAGKFTPDDGRVGLSLREENGWIEAVVEDTGRGIPADLLPLVFDLFVQGRQPLDRQGGGLGLGLAIVRQLVEMHGGEVAAQSEGEGRGSRFLVRLPVAPSRGEDDSKAVMTSETGGSAMSGRILIVDDNADAADTLADLLRLMGYEVRCAGEADAAMKTLDDYVPQLALLDIGLPGQDGYALAQRMRADPRAVQTKLVALTGYGRDNDRARAMDAQFDEHLVKPVSADKLMTVVQQMIG